MAGKELMARGDARRKAIYRFLQTYMKKNGWAPTVQEIADAVGLVSPNATRNHLIRLQQDGLITMQEGGARCIRLLPQPIKRITGDTTVREAKAFVTKNRAEVNICPVCGNHTVAKAVAAVA